MEQIERYLPQFLSQGSKEELFRNLKDFPSNIDSRMYCDRSKAQAFVSQGDGLKELKFVSDWNTVSIKSAPAIILSNTCDISMENKRNFPPFAVYCMLISFSKYLETLRSRGVDKNQVDAIAEDIRKQRTTNLFFLPKGQNLDEDKIALLDHAQSCPASVFQNTQSKLFSLSNYGFYMFLLKLSIHFTRIRDGLDRTDIDEKTGIVS